MFVSLGKFDKKSCLLVYIFTLFTSCYSHLFKSFQISYLSSCFHLSQVPWDASLDPLLIRLICFSQNLMMLDRTGLCLVRLFCVVQASYVENWLGPCSVVSGRLHTSLAAVTMTFLEIQRNSAQNPNETYFYVCVECFSVLKINILWKTCDQFIV